MRSQDCGFKLSPEGERELKTLGLALEGSGGASGSAYLRRVVGSFEKRRLACIAADGGRINY